MTGSWIFLMAACSIVKANSVENIYSDNGWRPTSNEKVFELQRNFIKTPLSVQMRNVQGNPMDNIFQRRTSIKILQPNHLNKESIKADEAVFTFPKENERNGRSFEDKKLKLERDNGQNNIQSMKPNNVMHTKDEEIREKHNAYEVNEILIEDLPVEQVKPRNEQDIKEPRAIIDNEYLKQRYNMYKYERTNLETNINKNLTSNLFNILANYNIRTGDKLPNYALSLRQNSRNSDSNYIYMHVPLKIPLRYNSQNHVPIDPLLAVFLSNYGHYLPGLFGFQRSYNNLYGYLASNSIHNNKPFGSYKVFSDTDSSQ